MLATDPQIVATAGEHFIAYKIAMLGFIPALVRQGSPTIDLLASNVNGGKTVGIQVKTTSSAMRTRGRGDKKIPFELQFPLGHRAIEATADSTIFCFVDLRIWDPKEGPEVYVISAEVLKREYEGRNIRQYSFFRHHRSIAAMAPYKNNWQPLIEALK